MGTSIGAAMDYLVATFQGGFNGKNIYGQTLVVPSLASINPAVHVTDTFDDNESGPWVVVGRDSWDQNSNITATGYYEYLGQEKISEAYTIPGMIVVEGSGQAFKPVRDSCIALFDGVTKLVWADPTLGGALKYGRIGLVSTFSLTQTDPTDDNRDSGAGIAAMMTFGVEVQNSYQP